MSARPSGVGSNPAARTCAAIASATAASVPLRSTSRCNGGNMARRTRSSIGSWLTGDHATTRTVHGRAGSPPYAGLVGDVDEFLDGLDEPTRTAMARVRDLALTVAPDATQGTGYGRPALLLAGRPLLAFAVTARHLALYPFSPAAVDAVRDRVAASDLSTGTVRFRATAPLAADVVRDLVACRAVEITNR